jgi:hypothetical protein
MPLTVTEKPNFTPADSDLARRVSCELSAFCRGFRRIEAWAESGIVTLSGPVKSYYSRQMAVVTANRVGGVHRVIDNLDVDLHPLLPCWKERNMKSPENFIYHCVTCGRIEQREGATAELVCCGQPMSVTCTEKQSSCAEENAIATFEISTQLSGKARMTTPRQQELKLGKS